MLVGSINRCTKLEVKKLPIKRETQFCTSFSNKKDIKSREKALFYAII